MITSFDDLIGFTERFAAKFPEFRSSIILEKPGYSQTEIDQFASMLPDMPETYWSVVKSLKLDGISIGYFQLTPQAYKGESLLEKLLQCNSPANPLHPKNQHYGLYQVASWEGDPICIACKEGTFKNGQVVKYNSGNPKAIPTVLSDNFEQFLLLAGNLDEVRDFYSESDDQTQAQNSFESRIVRLFPTSHQQVSRAWASISQAVLT